MRVAASLIDGAILMPITTPTSWIIGYGPASIAIAWLLLTAPTFWLYTVIGHGRYGQTLGKHIMDLRLVRADNGERIGYREAVRRDLPMIALSLIATTLLIQLVATGDTDAFQFHAQLQRDYASGEQVSFREYTGDMYRARFGNYPTAFWVASGMQMAWSLAEVTTMLSNRRRRALHDLIGGTVVVATNGREAGAVSTG